MHKKQVHFILPRALIFLVTHYFILTWTIVDTGRWWGGCLYSTLTEQEYGIGILYNTENKYKDIKSSINIYVIIFYFNPEDFTHI